MKTVLFKTIAILAVSGLLTLIGVSWKPQAESAYIFNPEAGEFASIIFYSLLAYLEGFALLLILCPGDKKRKKNKEKFRSMPISL